MNICAVICFYNAKAELARCLESLDLDKLGAIDKAICVDGKFPNFAPGEPNLSRELVKSYGNKTVLLDVADYELWKRNAYLTYLGLRKKFEFMLIIDSDEYIDPDKKNWPKFRRQISDYWANKRNHVYPIMGMKVEANNPDYVETVEKITGAPYNRRPRREDQPKDFQWKPRIWGRPWELEYFINHYSWRHKDPAYVNYLHETSYSISFKDDGLVDGIRILHDHKLRNQDYLDKRLEYHRWLIPFEQRKTHLYYAKHQRQPIPHDANIIEEWFESFIKSQGNE
jgi:hypothetical protein